MATPNFVYFVYQRVTGCRKVDMQMPVMNGIDATKLILERKGGHKLPLIVFVTAHVSSTFVQECLDCGATAYLPKPYTLAILKSTLAEVIEKLQHDSPA